MRQVPKFNLLPLFTLATLLECGYAILAPVLAFLFFSNHSPLFFPQTSVTKRSVLFGLCMCLSKLGSLFSNVLMGALSDRLGRTPPFYLSVVGLFLIGISGILALLLRHTGWLMSGLFVGLLLNSIKPNSMASLTDVTTPQKRILYFSSLQGLFALGAALGPLLGGYTASIALGNTLYFMPFLGCIVISLVASLPLIYLKETYKKANPVKKHPTQLHRGMLKLILTHKMIRKYLAFVFLSQLSWGCFYEFSPVIAKNTFHMEAQTTGLYMGLIAGWLMLSTSLLIPLCQRFISNRNLIYWAIISLLVGSLTVSVVSFKPDLPLAQTGFWVSALPIAFGDVLFFILVANKLSELIGSHQRGQLMGLIYIIRMGAWSVMGLLGGFLTPFFKNGAFMIQPVGVFILVVWMLSRVTEKKEEVWMQENQQWDKEVA